MEAQQQGGQVQREDIAYLTDRVLVNEGKPQVYGTQFHRVNGERKPRPIEDAETVDERRKSMQLTTLKDYAAFMDR